MKNAFSGIATFSLIFTLSAGAVGKSYAGDFSGMLWKTGGAALSYSMTFGMIFATMFLADSGTTGMAFPFTHNTALQVVSSLLLNALIAPPVVAAFTWQTGRILGHDSDLLLTMAGSYAGAAAFFGLAAVISPLFVEGSDKNVPIAIVTSAGVVTGAVVFNQIFRKPPTIQPGLLEIDGKNLAAGIVLPEVKLTNGLSIRSFRMNVLAARF